MVTRADALRSEAARLFAAARGAEETRQTEQLRVRAYALLAQADRLEGEEGWRR
jgi:hypothetical protein